MDMRRTASIERIPQLIPLPSPSAKLHVASAMVARQLPMNAECRRLWMPVSCASGIIGAPIPWWCHTYTYIWMYKAHVCQYTNQPPTDPCRST